VTYINAPLSETGRLRLARVIVDDGWVLRRAAERFSCAPAAAKNWTDRYRVAGSTGCATGPHGRCRHRTRPISGPSIGSSLCGSLVVGVPTGSRGIYN
jgi:hypothetical protein